MQSAHYLISHDIVIVYLQLTLKEIIGLSANSEFLFIHQRFIVNQFNIFMKTKIKDLEKAHI